MPLTADTTCPDLSVLSHPGTEKKETRITRHVYSLGHTLTDGRAGLWPLRFLISSIVDQQETASSFF